MDQIDALFADKTSEARAIVQSRRRSIEKQVDDVPFEVNKVIGQLRQETARREKLFKRKPT